VARLQGSVMLSVVIGEEGRARDIRVVRSLGLAVDENAIAAVAAWRFMPGTKGGQAVAVETQVECNFRLLTGPGEWSLAHAQFTAPPGATPPSILSAPYPRRCGQTENSPVPVQVNVAPQGPPPSVRVAFDVDAQGLPANIQVEDSSDPKCSDEVMALIREWRFQAALNDGTAVQSHARFDLTRGLGAGELHIDMAPAPPQKKQ
jgi:TonB family protein